MTKRKRLQRQAAFRTPRKKKLSLDNPPPLRANQAWTANEQRETAISRLEPFYEFMRLAVQLETLRVHLHLQSLYETMEKNHAKRI